MSNFEDRGNVRNKIGIPPNTRKVYAASKKPSGRNKEGIDAMIDAMPKRDRNDPLPGPSFMFVRLKSGENIHGTVQESDRFTITLRHAYLVMSEDQSREYCDPRLALTQPDSNSFVVIYKSDISYFTTRVLRNGGHYFDLDSEEV